jgi:preprotein translocase subunit SecY
MPYCPNTECPHRKKTGKPAEFMEGMENCSDCGTALVDEAPETGPYEQKQYSDMYKRILFTLFMLAIWEVLRRVSLPGLEYDSAPSVHFMSIRPFPGVLGNYSVLSLGLAPYFISYVAIEIFSLFVSLFNIWRTQGKAGRVNLFASACILTVPVALVLSYSLVQYLDKSLYANKLSVMLILTAGAFVSLILATQITRRGVGHGIGVLLIAHGISSAATRDFRMFLHFWEEKDFVPVIAAVLAFVLLCAVVVVVERINRPVPVKYSDGLTASIPLKMTTAGIVPVCALYVMFLPIRSFEFLAGVNAFFSVNSIIYYLLAFMIIVFFYYLLTSSFHDTDNVVSNLDKKGAVIDIPPDVSTERYLDSRLVALALLGALYLIFANFVPYSASFSFNFAFVLRGLPIIVFISIILDLRQEILARMKSTVMVKVSEMHDVDMAGLARSVLENKGIPCALRGYYHRALLYFFGPMIEISVLVPADRADEAREALERYV